MLVLPQTCAALPNPASIAILHQEFATLDMNALPLERACSHGGLPDPTRVKLTHVGEIQRRGPRWVLAVTLSFYERQGAGCGGSPVEHHHLVDAELLIHATTGEAFLHFPEAFPDHDL